MSLGWPICSSPSHRAPSHAPHCPCGIWNGERDRPGRRLQRPVANIFQSHSARTPNAAGETPALPPIVHPKMKTGKEPFKCGIRIAECGMGDPQITQITQISFSSSASSAKSADKTSCVRIPSSPSLVRAPALWPESGLSQAAARPHTRATRQFSTSTARHPLQVETTRAPSCAGPARPVAPAAFGFSFVF